jgi:N-acetylglucosaminyldiphosphoundecaprenol N-acetyl-beta-D-mannosaminyltransferase
VSVSAERARVGRLPIDSVDFAQALDAIEALVRSRSGGMVFTPNVDHVVLAEKDARFRAAYQAVNLSLVDGTLLLWAARLLGWSLPEKVSGSDLLQPLMQRAAQCGFSVYLLGGDPGVAEAARDRLQEQFPELRVVGCDDSRIDVDAVDEAIVERIARAAPALVLVALGAPKQEVFIFEQRARLGGAVCVGVGASLDFVAGTRRRAPRWISRIGLEWLYRLLQEPRRLARRYLLRDPLFAWILTRQLLGSGAR